jgi:hypothetical protein
MCCFFTVLLFLGPRAGILIWWLINPTLWSATFSSFFWPLLGFIFAPWTTMMYVLVAPGGTGIVGFDWIWLGLAVLADISMWAGGGFGNKDKVPGVSS